MNIAARVQGLAQSRSIFATRPVVEHAQTSALLKRNGLSPESRRHALRGLGAEMAIYEIP